MATTARNLRVIASSIAAFTFVALPVTNDGDEEMPVEPRQDVEVRCRFDGAWVAGFQVAESTDVGGERRYRLMRLSDGVVLPEFFEGGDIRAMTRKLSAYA